MMMLCLTSVRSFTTPERHDFLDEPPHYHTDDQLSDKFARLAKAFPDLARVHSLGQSIEGRDLIVIEISKNVRHRGLLVPMFKYVANMHGDETIGRELLIYLAEYLLLNYGIVPEVTRLVDNTDIFLMPSMNPDGFNRSTVSSDVIFLCAVIVIVAAVVVVVVLPLAIFHCVFLVSIKRTVRPRICVRVAVC